MSQPTVILNYEWALARPPGAEARDRALFLVFHAEDAELDNDEMEQGANLFQHVEWRPHMLRVELAGGRALAFARPDGEVAQALDEALADMDALWICALGKNEVLAHACFPLDEAFLPDMEEL